MKETAAEKKAYKDYDRLVKVATWWHKRKFPDASVGEQRRKYVEELTELEEVFEPMRLWFMGQGSEPSAELERQYYEEYADCFIVLAGWVRFEKILARDEIHRLSGTYSGEIIKHVAAIKRKLWVNHRRHFKIVDGVHRHEEVQLVS